MASLNLPGQHGLPGRHLASASDCVGEPNGDATFVYNHGTGPYPVVGEWDGSGTDTVGVKAGPMWLLRNTNGPGTPDVAPFDFGGANELPVVWTQTASIAELS